MIIESLSLIIINILFVLFIIKFLQYLISSQADTVSDRYHSIYQGGENIKAKFRRYSSNLYILVAIFLILHIIVFFILTLALVNNLNDSIFEIGFFMSILIYTILIIRKGVNYS